ncbi:MAG: amino acid deaminase [Marmoricola sp.]
MSRPPATIDRGAVAALADERVDWRHKAVPPALWGLTVAEVGRRRPRLSELPTPLLTLSRRALDRNGDLLAGWCAQRGLALAPHGKTTMAPQLWAEQVEAGAWGITVANQAQLAVARAFGVSRVMVANSLVSPLGLRWAADQLADDPGAEILVWADSVRTVALMHAALAAYVSDVGARPAIRVLVERGGAGGRTGARDLDTCVAVARAVEESPHLDLAGVAGYEGALAHDSDEQSMQTVRDYLRDLAEVHDRLASSGCYRDDLEPVVTAGGSAFFDVVAEVLGPLAGSGAEVVLRSGAYLAHDDGFYRHISPLGAERYAGGAGLRSAMHGWVRVTSQPEPGLALFDGGKRDLPFDEGLPEVQLRRPRGPGEQPMPVRGVTVTALNDQHGFLSFDRSGEPPVRVGDELRLGLSHPCTAFDKWTLVPVVDDPDAADPTVVDLVRTWF